MSRMMESLRRNLALHRETLVKDVPNRAAPAALTDSVQPPQSPSAPGDMLTIPAAKGVSVLAGENFETTASLNPLPETQARQDDTYTEAGNALPDLAGLDEGLRRRELRLPTVRRSGEGLDEI